MSSLDGTFATSTEIPLNGTSAETSDMAKAEKSVFIKAPVDKVFTYAVEPANQPDFWPSLLETTDIEPLPDGGFRDRWVYKMGGVRFKGSGETTEYVANRRFVNVTKGGIPSVQTWTFEPEPGGTRVTFSVDYTVPIPLLGKMAEALIVRMNQREADTLLANLRDKMEA